MILTATSLLMSGRLEETMLELDAGLTCLVGPNGSGKTSLLHALAGIGDARGDVRIDGVDPHSEPPARRRRLLSFLPASREIFWPLVASDLIRLGGGEPDAGLLDALGIADFAGRRLDRLSTGERSRVLIARALAPRPRVVLLDEPVSNLDALWQLKLLDHLRESARRDGQAMLIAMHDLDLAAHYADRLIIMHGRRIAADGDPHGLLAGSQVGEIFGIERDGGRWRPLRRPEDPRSSL